MPASRYERDDAAPLLIRSADRAPLGALLLVIAALWLAAAIGGLVSGHPAILPGLGSAGVYVAGALGAALAPIAFHWLVRGRIVAIGRSTVAVTVWWPLGRHAWREPLAAFREVRVDREQRPHRYGTLNWYVVRLGHGEPGRTIELARAKDPALIERRARAYARRCGLPLSWNVDEASLGQSLARGGGVAAAGAAGMPLSAGWEGPPERCSDGARARRQDEQAARTDQEVLPIRT